MPRLKVKRKKRPRIRQVIDDETLKARFLISLLDVGYIASAIDSTRGLSREKYYAYLKSDPEFKAEIENVLEMRLDSVEQIRDELMEDEKFWPAIKHYLNAKGKDRGYGNQLTIKGDDKNPVNIALSFDQDQLNVLLDAAKNIAVSEINKLHKQQDQDVSQDVGQNMNQDTNRDNDYDSD